MCFKNKGKTEDKPLVKLDRDIYYGEMTKNISNYSKGVFKLKIAFQWCFGALSVLLIIGLTIFYIWIIVRVLNKDAKTSMSEQTIITTIITSSCAYAVSVLGTLGVVLNYMFNKNDVTDNNQLLKSLLDFDNTIPNSTGSKSIDNISIESGLSRMVNDHSSEKEGK